MADTVDRGTDMVIGWLDTRYGNDGGCPKVIRIAGRGSVGKTSIARRVYHHPSMRCLFHNHKVWINLGGLHKDKDDLLQEIQQQLQLGETTYHDDCLLLVLDTADSDLLGEGRIPNYFRSLLHQLCAYDDRWNQNYVSRRSAIILTTRHDGEDELPNTLTLHMNKLEYSLARFFQPRALALSKCEHPPAIVAILEECYPDVLALHMFLHLSYVNPYRSKAEMEGLCNALHEHRNNTSRTMLKFCYNDMPINYKTCLQYLSIFSQGHNISRTRLIRRWLAEGLVTDTRLSSNKDSTRPVQLEDQTECVFDALIDRGFLCPGETSAAGKIKTCTMHPKIHEFIATDVSSFMDTCLPLDLAHRFSINSGISLERPSRSNDILSLLDSLPGSDQWQLLKVLDLEGCTDLKNKHLKNICKILLLKYLSLRNTGVTQLPKKIEKLQCLETLDIRQTKIRAIATKSIFLPMLKHLLAGSKGSPSRSNNNSHGFEESLATVELPSGTRRMERLEILSHIDASNNVDDLIDIGQLLQLRKLGVILDSKKASSLALLFKKIEKLHSTLRALSIQINHPVTSEGTVGSMASPPKLLQSLNIGGITSGLPDWITELDELTKLTLSETYLREDAIRLLGNLRILRCLRLRHKSYTGTKLTFNAEEFKHLKSLIVESCEPTSASSALEQLLSSR